MEQNVLVTKMIGIVVAVIVAAVVLVPICNSLTEGDGGSGSSGGSSSTVPMDGKMLNSINDVLVDDGVTSTYTGYDVYPDDRGYVAPISFAKTDIQKYIDSVTITGNMYYDSVNIPVLRISYQPIGGPAESDEIQALDIEIGVAATKSSNTVTGYISGGIEYQDHSYVTFEYQSLNDFQTVSIEIDTNANLDLNIVGGSDVSVAISDLHIDHINYLSDSKNCWMFFNLTPASTSLVVEEGSAILIKRIFAATVDGNWIYESEAIPLEITADMIANRQATITLTGTFAGDDYNITATIPLRYNEDTDKVYLDRSTHSTLTGGDSLEWDIQTIDQAGYVSTMNVVPASGGSSGGDSSGGSDLGVAGTIIGIIPVLVILAILMGAVGLFYQNRNGL